MKINLLPPEIGQRQKLRRRTLTTIAAGVVVVALIGGFYLLQVARLSGVEEEIQAQETRNAQLQNDINELQDIAALEAEIEASRDLLATLLSDQVLWSNVLRDISLVIPGEVWLNGITGQTGVTTEEDVAVAAPTPGAGLVGQISLSGFAFEHKDVAMWLDRLEEVRGFINPWLSSSTKSEIGTVEVVQFSSSVDLSEQALARRAGEE